MEQKANQVAHLMGCGGSQPLGPTEFQVDQKSRRGPHSGHTTGISANADSPSEFGVHEYRDPQSKVRNQEFLRRTEFSLGADLEGLDDDLAAAAAGVRP